MRSRRIPTVSPPPTLMATASATSLMSARPTAASPSSTTRATAPLTPRRSATTPSAANPSSASTPTQVAVLDIDRDGKLDLIVSCRSDGGTDISGGVSILRGRGDGTFVDQQIRTAHTSPTAVAIADYNKDGKLDIVAANFFSDDVSLLFNGTPVATS